MTTQLVLFKSANGHFSMECGDAPDSYWQTIVETLEQQECFTRSGNAVLGAGEMIHQDFVSKNFSLSAGWDNWSGHYLLANCSAGDTFLQQLYEHLAGGQASPPTPSGSAGNDPAVIHIHD